MVRYVKPNMLRVFNLFFLAGSQSVNLFIKAEKYNGHMNMVRNLFCTNAESLDYINRATGHWSITKIA